MTHRGSFGRNWSLIKLARTYHPHDIAGEILAELAADPLQREKVSSAAKRIGEAEGRRFLERSPEGISPADILDGYFLIHAIPTEADRESTPPALYVKKECGSLFPGQGCSPAILAAYISGFTRAIAPNALVQDGGDHLIISFPAPPEA
ncbi:MAG: hypothetical protein RQ758_09230 [Methanomicrobiaceae archaeon]|nr:hypothetical protein [Methanomicrobiaceae archaeon]